MDKNQLIEFVKSHSISKNNLISISSNFHRQKELGFFSSEKEKLKRKSQEFKKAYNISFLDWGSFIIAVENEPLISESNIDNYYSDQTKSQNNNDDVNTSNISKENPVDANYKSDTPSLFTIKKSLTQPKSRKYSGYSSINISNISSEIVNFFENQKFGWLAEAKPTVIVSENESGSIVRCYTAKTIVRTWGNSKETAINVTIEKEGDTIHFNCGFTGNKGVLSASSIGGAILTGGVSLAGNAASAIKDGKLVNSTIDFIDNMMKNQFNKDNSVNNISVDDIPSKIKKLSVLRDEGILTEEEFINKKSELLDKM